MRTFLIFVILSIGLLSLNAATWEVFLGDSGYDGWELDSSLTVYVNGIVVINHVTLDNYYAEYPFEVQDGDAITTYYAPPAYFGNEQMYSISNHLGDAVFISGSSGHSAASLTTPLIVDIPTSAPAPAYNPFPVNGATDVGLTGNITWTNGVGAEHYELWFGPVDNMSLVASGRAYETGSYHYGIAPLGVYTWQVRETNWLSTTPTVGPLWTATATVPPVAQFPYIQGFEDTPFPSDHWKRATGAGDWVSVADIGGFGASAHSAMADFWSIAGTTPFDLITCPLDMTDLDANEMTFDYAYATCLNGELDSLKIYSSTDYGISYTLLTTMAGGNTGELNTGGTAWPEFVPTASQWATKSVVLPWATTTVLFRAVSGFGNRLYLDNITFRQGPTNTILYHSLNAIKFYDLTVGDSYTDQRLFIGNTGTAYMILPQSGISIVGEDSDQFSYSPLSFPEGIAAGSGINFWVTFAPTSVGAKHAALRITYHETHYDIPLTGTVRSPDEFFENFEGELLPPDMWEAVGFTFPEGGYIHGNAGAILEIESTDPEARLITPYLDCDGSVDSIACFTASINTGLGFGDDFLQLKYQAFGSDTWLNWGAPYVLNQRDQVMRFTRDLTTFPHGVYRFAFAVTSSFAYEDYYTLVGIDDIYGPYIHNRGVLDIPQAVINSNRSLSWAAIPNAAAYAIYGSDNPDSGFTLIGTTNTQSWQDTRPTTTKAFYQVRALSRAELVDRTRDDRPVPFRSPKTPPVTMDSSR
jgi:hypothetical protein